MLTHGTLDLSLSRALFSTPGITDGMSINVQVQGRGYHKETIVNAFQTFTEQSPVFKGDEIKETLRVLMETVEKDPMS